MNAVSPSLRLSPAALLLAALAVSGAACTGPPAPPPAAGPPIVLITFEGLRADTIRALAAEGGLETATPTLDRLMEEADWAGRGVAASSRAAPAGASLMTGLQPWKHQLLDDGDGPLAPEMITLAEALGRLGYRTTAYVSGRQLSGALGFGQGFDSFLALRRGRRAQEHLRALHGEPELVWIHLEQPSPPWQRRDWLLSEAEKAQRLPRLVGAADLAPYGDLGEPLPADRADVFRTLYLNNVTWADIQLGRLLAALEESGQRRRVVLLVTSTHGQDLGEDGRLGEAGDLGPWLLEVPLAIDLPEGFGRRVAAPRGGRVAAVCLWAALLEAAAGEPPPGVAPSLFRDPGEPVLSELYGEAGGNHFSLLADGHQLLWSTPLGAPGPGGPAQGNPGLDPRGTRPGETGGAFDLTPPLSGGAAGARPRLTLLRWAHGGVERVEDPARAGALAQQLRASWSSFLSEELSPAREAADLSRDTPAASRRR